MMWTKLGLIALAGGLGTLCRYGLAGLVQKNMGSMFPWGTLAVNMAGCLVVGIVWAAFENRVQVPGELRTVILVGFMGAFTTFSTFIFESHALIQDSQWLPAALNMIAQNFAGVLFLAAGLMLGKIM